MIPLRLTVNGVTKDLWEIMEPEVDCSQMTEAQKISFALNHKMFPSEVKVSSEVYCRDADRTANYELENITNVNAKAKPEFTWAYLKAEYVQRLLEFLGFHYDYKDRNGVVQPEAAPVIYVTYLDFSGLRTIQAYLGQSIDGVLVEYENQLRWESFRIAFPER